MKPEHYYLAVIAISVAALGMSLYNFVQSLLDRRSNIKIVPCRVRPVGSSFNLLPLSVTHIGRQGVDVLYGFLIENRGRYSVFVSSVWEAVGGQYMQPKGTIVPNVFPLCIQAGSAALLVMDGEWEGKEGDYIVMQRVGGMVHRCKVPVEMCSD